MDDGSRPTLACWCPVVLEFVSGPALAAARLTSGYENVSTGTELVGEGTVDDHAGTRVRAIDTWRRLLDAALA